MVGLLQRLARHCLCRQSCLGFSSITLISSNRNDKLRSYSWDPSTLPVSTNPCQRGEIWWHSYRGERTLAAIITTKNSSELLTQLFKISKRNPKQTNYRNLRRNYWSCPSGIIWKPTHLRLSMTNILATSLFLSNTISYNFVLIILKCFSHNDFLPTKKCSPKKAEIFRNVYIINFHI